ncbi:hypothetical protein D3C76_36880 [compost metagenome]
MEHNASEFRKRYKLSGEHGRDRQRINSLSLTAKLRYKHLLIKEEEERNKLVVIETVVPIPMLTLKRKFTENVKFIIDYDNSKYKGSVLITYLTNLGINCEIKFSSLEAKLGMLKDYLHITSMVKLPEMEDLVINLLLAASGKPYSLPFNPVAYIDEHRDILEVWMQNVCMVPVYALQAHAAYKAEVEQYDEIPGESLSGINFVRLLDHPLFPVLIGGIPKEDWCWNRMFFNEYCFGGQNLFYYFAVQNNPYFMALLALDSPDKAVAFEQVARAELETSLAQLKGIEHVPSL